MRANAGPKTPSRSAKVVTRGMAGAVLFCGIGLVASCSNRAGDCALNGLCASDGSGGGSSSGGGGIPSDCSGDPSAGNTTDDCAVFVDPSAHAPGSGTRAAPFSSLSRAISLAGSKRVFACGAIDETVVAKTSFELWGGFDCTTWAWDAGARTSLTASADAIPLVVEQPAATVSIHQFSVTARDAMALSGSSIAMGVDAGVTLTLDTSDLTAGAGQRGTNGVPPTTAAKQGLIPTSKPIASCTSTTATGGAAATLDCGAGRTSGGGDGGDGSSPAGVAATAGGDGAPVSSKSGLGGSGQTASACGNGVDGSQGSDGQPGPGGDILNASLTLAGVTHADGFPGTIGNPGQGGGGGGGGLEGVCGTTDKWGPGGGAGGTGGCGGQSGEAGGQGGSSIALLSLGTDVTLTSVTLRAGRGGQGGFGAAGQTGGAGAKGDAGIAPACDGANGGIGGTGGAGGGGSGGHSLALAFTKAPPASVLSAAKNATLEAAGNGGFGPANNTGAIGKALVCWDFGAHAPCQ